MTVRVAIGSSSFAAEDDSPLEMLRAAGCDVALNPYGRRLDEAETIAHLAKADGLVAGLEPLTKRVIASAPQLKAIARVGIGMTNVDLDAARELGVKVSNTPDEPTQAVAEMTMAALLALCRPMAAMNAALHAGDWRKLMGTGLAGTPVLIIGFGRIGRRVAALLDAFRAVVYVHDPYVEADAFPAYAHRADSLAGGLAAARIVTLHASGADCLLDAAAFDAMQDGTRLLNSARGELVDEEALIAALDSGRVAGAWFDAFWTEPYAGPLCGYEQVLLTPHVSTYTRECRLAMETAAARNLLRDLGMAPPAEPG